MGYLSILKIKQQQRENARRGEIMQGGEKAIGQPQTQSRSDENGESAKKEGKWHKEKVSPLKWCAASKRSAA